MKKLAMVLGLIIAVDHLFLDGELVMRQAKRLLST